MTIFLSTTDLGETCGESDQIALRTVGTVHSLLPVVRTERETPSRPNYAYRQYPLLSLPRSHRCAIAIRTALDLGAVIPCEKRRHSKAWDRYWCTRTPAPNRIRIQRLLREATEHVESARRMIED